jgi:hypothetical protein
MTEQKDNLIQLKDLKADVEFHDNALYNIQWDMRLVLNAMIPEIQRKLIEIQSTQQSTSNAVNSLAQLNKNRDEELNGRLDKIDKHNINMVWAMIITNTVLVLAYMIFH